MTEPRPPFSRNVLIHPDTFVLGQPATTAFKGEWIAVPREDFDSARDTLDSLTAERRGLREALTAALDQWAMYANEERGPGPEHFDPGEPANSYLTLIENGTDPEAQKFAECRAALFEGGSK